MKNLFLLYLLVVSLHLGNKRDISPIKDHGLIYGGHTDRVIIKLRASWSYKRGVYTRGGAYIRGFTVCMLNWGLINLVSQIFFISWTQRLIFTIIEGGMFHRSRKA